MKIADTELIIEAETTREQMAKLIVDYKERKSLLPPLGLAEIHDPNRADLDHPAPTLDVNRAVRSATYEVK